jgi:uncharacterized protein (DUF1499 family)
MFRIIVILLVILLVGIVALLISLRIGSERAQRPAGLGVSNGQLAPCTNAMNCVSSQAITGGQPMPAIPYTSTLAEAKTLLLAVVQAMPRVTQVTGDSLPTDENYLAFVFRSAMMNFPDDVEFYFDDQAKLIHFRSAARVGRGDLGVNQARMVAITQAFTAGGSSPTP